jgi:hypothetical protein
MPTKKKFQTVEELQKIIDDYFDWCDNRMKKQLVKDQSGAYLMDVPSPRPYTVEGISAWLGVERQTVLNYEKKPGYEQYFDTIRDAKRKILADLMERGLDKTSDGSMSKFNLINNYGFSDQPAGAGSNEHTVKIVYPEE